MGSDPVDHGIESRRPWAPIPSITGSNALETYGNALRTGLNALEIPYNCKNRAEVTYELEWDQQGVHCQRTGQTRCQRSLLVDSDIQKRLSRTHLTTMPAFAGTGPARATPGPGHRHQVEGISLECPSTACILSPNRKEKAPVFRGGINHDTIAARSLFTRPRPRRRAKSSRSRAGLR